MGEHLLADGGTQASLGDDVDLLAHKGFDALAELDEGKARRSPERGWPMAGAYAAVQVRNLVAPFRLADPCSTAAVVVQVYLDLKAHPERASEAAEELRKRLFAGKAA